MAEIDVKKISELSPVNGSSTIFNERQRQILRSSAMLLPLADPNGELDDGNVPDTYRLAMDQLIEVLGVSGIDSMQASINRLLGGTSRVVFVDYGHREGTSSDGKTIATAYANLSSALAGSPGQGNLYLCFGRTSQHLVVSSVANAPVVYELGAAAAAGPLKFSGLISAGVHVFSDGPVEFSDGCSVSGGPALVHAAGFDSAASYNCPVIHVESCGPVSFLKSATATQSMSFKASSVSFGPGVVLSSEAVSVDSDKLETDSALSVSGSFRARVGLFSGFLSVSDSSSAFMEVGKVSSSGNWLSTSGSGKAFAFVGERSSSASVSGNVKVSYAGEYPITFDAVVSSAQEVEEALEDSAVLSVFMKGDFALVGHRFHVNGPKVIFSELPVKLADMTFARSPSGTGSLRIMQPVEISGQCLTEVDMYVTRVSGEGTLETAATGITCKYEQALEGVTIQEFQQEFWHTSRKAVQADWSQSDSTADDFIKNKPNIPEGVVVDQSYSPDSTNAASGKAVAQAVSDKAGAMDVIVAQAKADSSKADSDYLMGQGHTEVVNLDGTLSVSKVEAEVEREVSSAECFAVDAPADGGVVSATLRYEPENVGSVSLGGTELVLVEGTPGQGQYSRQGTFLQFYGQGMSELRVDYTYRRAVTSDRYIVSGGVSVPQVEIESPDGFVKVDSTINTGTNVKTFSIYGSAKLQYGRFSGNGDVVSGEPAGIALNMQEGNVPVVEGKRVFEAGMLDISVSLGVTFRSAGDSVVPVDLYAVVGGAQTHLEKVYLDGSLTYRQSMHVCDYVRVDSPDSELAVMVTSGADCYVDVEVSVHTMLTGCATPGAGTPYVEDAGVYVLDVGKQTLYPKVVTPAYGNFYGNGNVENVMLSGAPLVEGTLALSSVLSGTTTVSSETGSPVNVPLGECVTSCTAAGVAYSTMIKDNTEIDLTIPDESVQSMDVPEGMGLSRVYSASRPRWTEAASRFVVTAGTYCVAGGVLYFAGNAEEAMSVEFFPLADPAAGHYHVNYSGRSAKVTSPRLAYTVTSGSIGSVQVVRLGPGDTLAGISGDYTETWREVLSVGDISEAGDYFYESATGVLNYLGYEGEQVSVDFYVNSTSYEYEMIEDWTAEGEASFSMPELSELVSLTGSNFGAYTRVDVPDEGVVLEEGTYCVHPNGTVSFVGSSEGPESVSVKFRRTYRYEPVQLSWVRTYLSSDWKLVGSADDVANPHEYHVSESTGDVTFRASSDASFGEPEEITASYSSYSGVLDSFYWTYETSGSDLYLEAHLNNGTFYKFAILPELTIEGTKYTTKKLRFKLGAPATGYVEQAGWEMVAVPESVVSTEIFVGGSAINYGNGFPASYSMDHVYQVSVKNGKAVCETFEPINATDAVYNFQVIGQ